MPSTAYPSRSLQRLEKEGKLTVMVLFSSPPLITFQVMAMLYLSKYA